MDGDDDFQDTEQWNYLDGTPASRPDPVEATGGLAQTFANMINPLNWFRTKPAPRRTVANQKNVRRTVSGSTGGSLSNVPRIKMGNAENPDRAKKRRRAEEDVVVMGERRRREAEMPPNIDFVPDERPKGYVSPSTYMTDDDDSDVEMISGPSGEDRKKKLVNQFQISEAGSSSTAVRRAPLTERIDVSGPSTPPQRPFVVAVSETVNPTRISQIRPVSTHQLAEQTKSPATGSKKRGFGEVDKEDALPSLFSSNFPRAGDRKPTGLLPVSRFSYNRAGAETPSIFSIKPSPIKNVKTDSGRSSPITSGFRLLPTPTRSQSAQQKPQNRSALKLTGLDYSYIVPTKPFLPEDGEDFTFHSPVFVPNGSLARDIDITDLVPGDTAEPNTRSITSRCQKCGITLRNGERGCSVCDRACSSPSAAQNPLPTAASATDKPRKDYFVKDTGTIGAEKSWICDLCREENSAAAKSCKQCFKARVTGTSDSEKRPPSRQPIQEEVARKGSAREESQKKSDQERSRPASEASSSNGSEKNTRTAENSESSRPASTSANTTSDSSAGIVDIWAAAAKKSKSGWKCGDCGVSNDDTAVACVCCTAPKPGAAPAQSKAPTQSTGTWGFGGPQPTSLSVPTTTQSSTQPPVPSIGGFNFANVKPLEPVATSTAATAPISNSFFGSFNPVTTSQPASIPSSSITFGPVENGPSNLGVKKSAEAPTVTAPPPSLASGTTSVFSGFTMPSAITSKAEAPKENGISTSGTSSTLPSTAPAPSLGGFSFSAVPAPSFQFGTPGAFTGFGSSAPASSATGFGSLLSSSLANAPTSNAAPTTATSFFGQPKIDTASFSFGQPVQNGQSNAVAPTIGAPTTGSLFGGMPIAPSPSVLSMLGQQPSPAFPTIGSGIAPAAGPRRIVKAKRNLQR